MAVTITRSIWIDDDGTGTTGTVINQALHTTLYNEIDTALAKVAQLAGGNTYSGNQLFNAATVFVNTLTNPANGQLVVLTDGSVRQAIALQNVNTNNVCYYVYCLNSAGGATGGIAQASATTLTFNTSSDARLKNDAGRATDLASLRAVVVHDFTWNADGVRDRGVFAQDAHALYPRAVTAGTDETTDDGSLAHPWMTDYSKFVPDLIVGWQQHDAAIANLRAALAGLSVG
jgi:hypothetical protein